MRGPAHGYLMAKIINNVIGPFAKLSNGRFYPLLTKLEREGIIVAAPYEEGERNPGGERNARRYAITEAGRERFRQMMLDTTVLPGDHQRAFLFKVTSLDLLEPAERLRVIDHYLHYCEAHVFHTHDKAQILQAKGEALAAMGERGECDFGEILPSPKECEAIVEVIEHVNRVWELEVEWVKQLRAKQEAVLSGALAKQAGTSTL